MPIIVQTFSKGHGSKSPAPPAAAANLHLWPAHRPPLAAGTYRLTVHQYVKTPDGDTATVDQNSFLAERTFAIAGARFTLQPDDVQAVYPPAGSAGDYRNVLPHVVLKRSTLPWVRSAASGAVNDASPPWLALLVLRADEFRGPTPSTLGDLRKANAAMSALDLEGSEASDLVNVLSVKAETLADVVPTGRELALLAHVRGRPDLAVPGDDSVAVIFSKRLPKVAGEYTAHLVSLEGRYAAFDAELAVTKNSTDFVPLVCLRSWSFTSTDSPDSLKARLAKLKSQAAALHWPLPVSSVLNPKGDRRLSRVPIVDRSGAKAAPAWYHGPLVGTSATTPGSEPDRSYSAASQLGRLLALQSQSVTTALIHLEHRRAHATAAAKDAAAVAGNLVRIVHPAVTASAPEMPHDVLSWLKRCSLLEGVPFHYLVPDENMLPLESMRYFTVDDGWVQAMLAGALQIEDEDAVAVDAPIEPDDRLGAIMKKARALEPVQHGQLSGVILRSQVVVGWPTLLPEAADKKGKLTMLRSWRPSPNVLVCLFDGVVESLTFRNPPTLLHFEVGPGRQKSVGPYQLLVTNTPGDAAEFARSILQSPGG